MKTYDSSSSWNEEQPSMAKRRGPLRVVVAIFTGIYFWAPLASHSAILNYLGSGDLDDKKSWSTQNIPTSSDSAVFNVGNSTIQSTGSLDFGNFVWNNNTNASISLKANGIIRYLTLSGGGGATAASLAGGSSTDLLLMGNSAKTNTLKFEAIPGNGELQIKLGADGNFNVLNAGATLDIATVITGSQSLTKTGNGNLILGAANTYTGATTVNAGTLTLSGSLNSSSVTVNGASAVLNETPTGVIAGTGTTFTLTSGNVRLAGNNTYTGATTVNAGTLSIAAITNAGVAGALGNSTNAAGNLVLGGGTLEYNGSTNGTTDRNFTLTAGTISGISVTNSTVSMSLSGTSTASTGGLSKSGQGTLILAGNNTYAGATTINAGTLQMGAGATAGSISSSSAITNNGMLVINRSDDIAVASVISGSGNVTQSGGGALTLSNASNSYTGTTLINSGSISISSIGNVGQSSAVGAGSTIKIGSGSKQGTLAYTGIGASTNKTIDVAGTTGTAQIYANNSSGLLLFTSNFTASGIGAKTLNIGGASQGEIAGNIVDSSAGNATSVSKIDVGTWTLSGTNSFTGNLSAQNGNLIISSIGNVGQNSAAGAGSMINIGSATTSGTLTYTGSAATSNKTIALAGTTGNATIVQNGAGLLKFSGNFTSAAGSKTLFLQGSGVAEISGALVNNNLTNTTSLTKNGAGTWILSGNNTYTGATTISAGTLQFAKTASFYNGSTPSWTSSNIIVNTGATLALNTGGAGEFTSAGINTISSIGSASNGFLNNSTLALDTTNAGGSFTHSGNVSNTNGGSNVLNVAKIGTGTLVLNGNNTYTGATTVSAGTLEIGSAGRLGGGSYSGNIANNATFLYSGTSSQRLSGVISGTGALTQNGSGRLLLSGNNTYTGSTTISVGTLEIGSAGRLGGGSYSGNIANNATFIYSGANNQTLSGVISGTGALTQNGSGRLRLTGNNTYQGKTTVQSGTLEAASTGALGATSSIDLQGGSLLIAASNTINDQANIVMGNAKLAMSGQNITERVGALTLTGNSVIDVRELQGTSNALYFASSYQQQGWAANTSLSIWNWDFSNTNHIYFGSNANGLSKSQLQQISFYSDFGNSFIGNAFISNTGEISAVPEAQTMVSAMLILLGTVVYLMKKRYTSG